jgi:ribulose-5-phosphate 4-epimerase/fuculose-1-phosphate aldolase
MPNQSEKPSAAEEHLQAYLDSLPEAQQASLRAPEFTSAAAERRHRQERLAATFRIFAKFGFSSGVAGHVTVRDPEFPDRFWVNPLGLHFGRIRVSDLLLVDHAGKVVVGNRPVNPAAFAIHAAVHKARPDVMAVAHAHTVHGMAWASLGRPLDPITQDACAFYEDHALFGAYDGSPIGIEDGAAVAAALGRCKAILLQNHGLLTAAQSIEACAWWFVSLERCCQVQLLAKAAGSPRPIPHEVARATCRVQGNPDIGRFNFQPLWERISAEQPDLFE